MRLVDRLQNRFGRLAIRNMMVFIVAGMSIVFIADFLFGAKFVEVGGIFERGMTGLLAFDRALVLQGQVWRLITFIFLPPSSSPLFVVFALYFYWFIGSALEDEWGSFKFDLYYLCGVLCTIAAGFISGYATNVFLNLSLFLAFAIVYPNYQLRIFFLIPVKVKWLALLDVAVYLLYFIFGTWNDRATIIAALLNVFIFFGRDMFFGTKNFINRIRRRGQFDKSYYHGQRENRDYWKNR